MIENNTTNEIKLYKIVEIVGMAYTPAKDGLASQLSISTRSGFTYVFIDYADCNNFLSDIVDKFYENEDGHVYVDVKNFRISDKVSNKLFVHLDEGVEY